MCECNVFEIIIIIILSSEIDPTFFVDGWMVNPGGCNRCAQKAIANGMLVQLRVPMWEACVQHTAFFEFTAADSPFHFGDK
jgi:hypothetical protein